MLCCAVRAADRLTGEGMYMRRHLQLTSMLICRMEVTGRRTADWRGSQKQLTRLRPLAALMTPGACQPCVRCAAVFVAVADGVARAAQEDAAVPAHPLAPGRGHHGDPGMWEGEVRGSVAAPTGWG